MKPLLPALLIALFLPPSARAGARPVCVQREDGTLACVSQDEFNQILRQELQKRGHAESDYFSSPQGISLPSKPRAPKARATKPKYQKPSQPAPLLGDYWHYPLDHKWPISSPFGWRTISKNGEEPHKDFHPGLDLAVYAFTPVFPARPGKVLFAGEVKGFGQCVIIEHANHYRSIYGHLTEVLVRSGQRIERRIPLGLSGNTGDSLGAHLHFEVRSPANKAVNPAPLLGVPANRTASNNR